jgi:hypothetical protein
MTGKLITLSGLNGNPIEFYPASNHGKKSRSSRVEKWTKREVDCLIEVLLIVSSQLKPLIKTALLLKKI